jgi:cysteinyl-tRNA synthetase
MNDDLNSPIVIAHLFDASRAINSVKDGKATISAEDLKELQEVFHLFIFDILGMKDEAASAGGNNYEAFGKAIDLLLSIRQQAKANKDWATSDKIRNELTAFGFEIKDTKDGAEWKLSK